MFTIDVLDPNDSHNPIPRRILQSADGFVVYHGTSSAWCEDIEKEGFAPGKLAYDMSDAEAVANAFKRIGWAGRNGLLINMLFSVGGERRSAKASPHPANLDAQFRT